MSECMSWDYYALFDLHPQHDCSISSYTKWVIKFKPYCISILNCTRAIISCGLYIFYPIFQCGLWSRAIIITDNLCTKQGNVGLKSAWYNGACTFFKSHYSMSKPYGVYETVKFLLNCSIKKVCAGMIKWWLILMNKNLPSNIMWPISNWNSIFNKFCSYCGDSSTYFGT